MRVSKRFVLGGTAILAAAGATFGVVYGLRGPDEVSIASGPLEPPGPDVTPAPGVTPNTDEPFWHIPYVNEDQKLPQVAGTINGITIDPNRQGPSGFELCPGTGLHPAEPGRALDTVTAPGPLRIDPRALPAGVEPFSGPEPFLCGNDLLEVSWTFLVKAGTPDVNVGGSNLTITRTRGVDYVNFGAPARRWTATQIAGRPAVVAGPVVVVGKKQFGPCFAAVYDKGTGILTTVLAGAANGEFCATVAERVVS